MKFTDELLEEMFPDIRICIPVLAGIAHALHFVQANKLLLERTFRSQHMEYGCQCLGSWMVFPGQGIVEPKSTLSDLLGQ